MNHLRLAPRTAPRPDLTEQLAESASPAVGLSTPPVLGVTGPASMSPLLAARLAAWRELSARWPIFIVLPVLMALGPLLRPEIADAWSLFLAVMIAPAVCVGAAAGGESSADAFWRGLGGPSWARMLGRQALHLALVGSAVLVMWVDLVGISTLADGLRTDDPEILTLGLLGLYAALYTSTAAARTRLSGVAVIAGPLAALLVVGAGMLASIHWIRDWNELLGILLRTTGVSVLALALAYRWEGRVGVWGGAIKRRMWVSPVAWILAAALASIGVEWGAGYVGVLPVGYRSIAIAPDASVSVFSADDTRMTLDPARLWIWTEAGGYERLPGTWTDVYVGPDAAVLTFSEAPEVPMMALHHRGQSLSCPVSGADIGSLPSWRGDGRVVLASQDDDEGWTRSLAIDLDAGTCGEIAPSHWLAGERLSMTADAVQWGAQSVPWPDGALIRSQGDMLGRPAILRDADERMFFAAVVDGQLVVQGPIARIETTGEPTAPLVGQWGADPLISGSLAHVLLDLSTGRGWRFPPLTGSHRPAVGLDTDGILWLLNGQAP